MRSGENASLDANWQGAGASRGIYVFERTLRQPDRHKDRHSYGCTDTRSYTDEQWADARIDRRAHTHTEDGRIDGRSRTGPIDRLGSTCISRYSIWKRNSSIGGGRSSRSRGNGSESTHEGMEATEYRSHTYTHTHTYTTPTHIQASLASHTMLICYNMCF